MNGWGPSERIGITEDEEKYFCYKCRKLIRTGEKYEQYSSPMPLRREIKYSRKHYPKCDQIAKTIKLRLADGSPAILKENSKAKILISENYKYAFNKSSGLFFRWGKTQAEDGDLRLGLPEIADIEISTICSGLGVGCNFCYKSNTTAGKYMSLRTFKKILHNLPPTVTQIAFGIGNINANPDMWDIFDCTRKHGLAANVTVNGVGMSEEVVNSLSEKCNAVAVSLYDKNITYNTVEKLTNKGMKQVNIHCMISSETFGEAMMVASDCHTDSRLKNLNAIVFLSLKPKGRGKTGYTRMTDEQFKELVDFALEKNTPFGFDSCTAERFLSATMNHPRHKEFMRYIEPCEAGIYSSYINVKGDYFPCSFIEGVEGWEQGIDTKKGDFLENVWNNPKTKEFREKIIACRKCSRACGHYKLEGWDENADPHFAVN